MLGFLLMGVAGVMALYVLCFKFYPAIAFRYAGVGERRGRAEYGRIRREHPDCPEARLSEAEFVESFIRNGPAPWKYLLAGMLLALVGLPASCMIRAATALR